MRTQTEESSVQTIGLCKYEFYCTIGVLIHLSHEEKKRNACEPKSPKWALRTLLSWASRNFHDLRFVHLQFCCSSIEEVLVRMYLHPGPFCLFSQCSFLPACFVGRGKLSVINLPLLLHNVQYYNMLMPFPYLLLCRLMNSSSHYYITTGFVLWCIITMLATIVSINQPKLQSCRGTLERRSTNCTYKPSQYG